MDVQKIFSILEQEHQFTMLEQFQDSTLFQVVVMTLLSSRTKDTTTIPIVKRLFKKYPAPQDFLKIPLPILEKELYGIGFYRVKAKNIKKLCKIILEKYHGEVPQTFEELTSLPGVGRKTANCVLSYALHQPAIAVDIHVHRISNRLGWVKTTTPEETEEALKKVVPKELWSRVNELFVDYGQRVCLPRNPRCGECKIRKWCEFGKHLS